MTIECGVFGYPIGHSISAVFQQAAFDFLGLDISYRSWQVSPEEFPARLRELREPRFLGANVTIPHKESALEGVDHADPVAVAVGAVNTVVRVGSDLHGHNTDVPGFLDLLARDCRQSPLGDSALLIGAGGAARAVSLALVLTGARRLVIANRSIDRAQRLGDHLRSIPIDTMRTLRTRMESHLEPLGASPETPSGGKTGSMDLLSRTTNEGEGERPPTATHVDERVVPRSGLAGGSLVEKERETTIEVAGLQSDAFRDAVRACRFVVNCTSAGMLGAQKDASPLPHGIDLRPDAIVIDVVANPLRTTLITNTLQSGRRAIGGLPMLIYQGAESFTIWTGRAAPLDVMREAALSQMRKLQT